MVTSPCSIDSTFRPSGERPVVSGLGLSSSSAGSEAMGPAPAPGCGCGGGAGRGGLEAAAADEEGDVEALGQ